MSNVDATRSILKVGGTVIDFIEWSNEYSGVMEAGTFRCTVDAPFARWPWWAQQTEIMVDVYAGTPPNPQSYSASDLTYLMRVRCDQIEMNPELQRIEISGRDLTSLLTDNKTSDKWINKTSSQIATLIAAKMGFDANIQPTTSQVGTFYNTDHVNLAKVDTYWNILTYLAQRERYQVHVLGKTLYFGNFAAQNITTPYLIQFAMQDGVPSSNAHHLKFSRDLTIANDISVIVRSYHGYLNAAFTGTATATKVNKKVELSAELAQSIQHYDFTIERDQTKAQCELKASELLKSISQHELKMEARIPFDTILYPWVQVQVQGTNTVWDATYAPKRVSRSFSKDRVTMELHANSGIPAPTVVL